MALNFTKTMPWSAVDVARLYKETDSGHWFDKDTMRFFGTKLTAHFRRLNDKTALFITTEQESRGGPRFASVRIAMIEDYRRENGDLVSRVRIDTLGPFCQYTLYLAKKRMREMQVVFSGQES